MAKINPKWSMAGNKIEEARNLAFKFDHDKYRNVATQEYIAQQLDISLATYKRRLVVGDFSIIEIQKICNLLAPFINVTDLFKRTYYSKPSTYRLRRQGRSEEIELFADFCDKLIYVDNICSATGAHLFCNITRNGSKYFLDYYTYRLFKYCSFTPEDDYIVYAELFRTENLLKDMGGLKKENKFGKSKNDATKVNFRPLLDDEDYIELLSSNEQQFLNILITHSNPDDFSEDVLSLFYGIRLEIKGENIGKTNMSLETFDELYNDLYNTMTSIGTSTLRTFLKGMESK